MSNLADWFPITIKFRGKCFECGKEIASGQEALWSKSVKAIKHLEDCSVINAADQQTSVTKEHQGDYVTHKQEEKQLTRRPKRFLQTTLPKCFICGKQRSGVNEYDPNEYGDYEEDGSESYICQSCLQREDAFEAYQQSFLEKINKYLKRTNEVSD
jgi:hypothetical protein